MRDRPLTDQSDQRAPTRQEQREARARVREFVRQWNLVRSRVPVVMEIHFDVLGELATLSTLDLELISKDPEVW